MKKNILVVLLLTMSAINTYAVSDRTLEIYRNVASFFLVNDMVADNIEWWMKESDAMKPDAIKNGSIDLMSDLFRVVDMTDEHLVDIDNEDLNTDNGIYQISLIFVSHTPHFYMLIQGTKIKIYWSGSWDWLMRDLLDLHDVDGPAISSDVIIRIIRNMVYKYGKTLFSQIPLVETYGNISYYRD